MAPPLVSQVYNLWSLTLCVGNTRRRYTKIPCRILFPGNIDYSLTVTIKRVKDVAAFSHGNVSFKAIKIIVQINGLRNALYTLNTTVIKIANTWMETTRIPE
jgi:hypothetical protein